jgi:Coenzyme PQQ synthesis protein D (PqqD)
LTIELCAEQSALGGRHLQRPHFYETFWEMITLSEFALDLVLRPNPEVIAKRLDQATVLVDISTSRIFELNETGTRIWELLGHGLNVEQIVQHLVSEFEVEDSQAAEDLKALLSQLRDQGLVAA